MCMIGEKRDNTTHKKRDSGSVIADRISQLDRIADLTTKKSV